MIIKSYEINKIINNKKNIYLFYGENEGYKNEIIKNFFEINFLKKIYRYDEKEILENKENFYNSILTKSFFENEKLIIISRTTDKIKDIVEEIIEKKVTDITIVLNANLLEKKSKLRNFFEKNNKTLCIPCYLDNEKNLEIIAKVELKKDNIILSQESINLLIEKSNGDRDNLKNEIEKIQAFALNNKKIGYDEVKSLTNFSGEYKSDNLINECLCGNVLQYKKNLSEVYTNTINQVLLLRILNNKIQRLLNMKKMQAEYSNLDSLLGASKPPVFWKDKPLIKKQLAIWCADDLKKTSSEISNIEILCKKNPQISKIIFFNFFSKICKKANSFS